MTARGRSARGVKGHTACFLAEVKFTGCSLCHISLSHWWCGCKDQSGGLRKGSSRWKTLGAKIHACLMGKMQERVPRGHSGGLLVSQMGTCGLCFLGWRHMGTDWTSPTGGQIKAPWTLNGLICLTCIWCFTNTGASWLGLFWSFHPFLCLTLTCSVYWLKFI